MNRPPAFQFYPKDWLDFRVQRMSLAAQGAYLKILCFMWTDSRDQCSILDENALLARAIGTTVEQWEDLRKEIQCESDPILKEKQGENRYLVSARLHQEAVKQRNYRKVQSEKGKRSAEQRLNHGSTSVQPMHQPEANSSSSSSSSILKTKSKSAFAHNLLNGHRHNFNIFWTAYPKHEGKKLCEQWWAKHTPDDVLLGVMLAKIEQAKQTPRWNEKDGQFIPMPATWLNQERWEDEYQAAIQHKARLPL